MIKFLADECVHTDLIKALREADYNVLTISEVGLSCASDEIVFDKGKELQATLLTFDRGFGDIFRFDFASSYGIVILLIYQMTKQEIINRLLGFLSYWGSRDLEGKLVIIGKERIRISER